MPSATCGRLEIEEEEKINSSKLSNKENIVAAALFQRKMSQHLHFTTS